MGLDVSLCCTLICTYIDQCHDIELSIYTLVMMMMMMVYCVDAGCKWMSLDSLVTLLYTLHCECVVGYSIVGLSHF